jgi:maltooligosyltrehalose trehalohydrolase
MPDHYEHRLDFGARLGDDGVTDFRLWAPSVDGVRVKVDSQEPLQMQPAGDGWYCARAKAAAGARYRFIMPDGTAVPDPASRAQEDCVHGASLVVDPDAFAWRATNWRNRPWHEAVIYEIHPGVAGGFKGIEAKLAEFLELGVTAIELMPIADFPGAHNWGYDGVLPFAPDRAYGTPDDLKSLIDAAHALGLMILLDVVYNHFGPDGAYLHVYAKEFFDPHVHTPWGAAIDFTRKEVRDYFIGNALMWLQEYRFDGLRFDAVHAISPPEFLTELAASIRARTDRQVHLILEHEGNKSSILREGPLSPGFDAQWADDWHHCLHVLLTGESEGYYESFQEPAEQLAKALAEGFVYQGQISPHHGVPRGEPSGQLPPTAFVVCLQNHDQIGNRAMGERLTALADPQALRAAATLLLLQPFIPMLFMGEEWGTQRPFLFFTDHNEQLADLVRNGRREEFKHFAAFQDEATRANIPDPNAVATFRASIPDGTETLLSDHGAILEMHRELIGLRKRHVIPGIPGCESLGAEALSGKAVRAAWRLGTGSRLEILANFGDAAIDVEQPPGDLIYASSRADPIGRLPARTTLVYVEECA